MTNQNRTLSAACLTLLMTASYGQTVTAELAVGSNPYSVAVNPITNKIYVTNQSSSTVTVIDGATNRTTTIPTGLQPEAVAVNPVTNKIYVVNGSSDNVTVIDGADNTTTTVNTGSGPNSVAVNPVTNKIYVSNGSDGNVTVIDGATNATTTVPAGSGPTASAVNTVTNKIYIPNYSSSNVTVIDGATNTTTTIPTASNPWKIGVNPVTNKIYVAGRYGIVTVIDGATNSAAFIALGPNNANGVAVNTVTNKVYIPMYTSNVVAVIDGATNDRILLPSPGVAFSAAVNPVTNQIYVTNEGATSLMVMDGATNATTSVAMIGPSEALVVNPITNKVYVVNYYNSSVTVIDGTVNVTAMPTVGVGYSPLTAAVNPVTNKIYVANTGTNDVTVIDGASGTTTTVPVGSYPAFVALNPVTNKIYVANTFINTVMVIDGITNTTTTIPVGTYPDFVAVNPVTNKIYVANSASNNVTVIDGVTNATTKVPVGTSPNSLAVNPVTNKIYVPNNGSSTVTVIDGISNTTTTVAAGTNPLGVAVNPVTNTIYVANLDSSNVTVIDGATNATATVPVGPNPFSVAVNPVTNKAYVASYGNNTVTVIDGVTLDTMTVPTGTTPHGVAVNPVTNKIYVPNYNSNSVTVIDGATLSRTTVGAGLNPISAAVNPVTNKIYVLNQFSNSATVITEQQVQPIPLTTSITPLSNNQSTTLSPSFTFTAASTTATIPDAVYFQVDTWQNAWTRATGTNPTFTGTVGPLQPGFHILYAFTGDSREATTSGSPADTSTTALIGSMQAYGFLVTLVPSTVAVSSGSGQSTSVNAAFTNPLVALVTDSEGDPVPNVAVTFTAPVQTGSSATFAGGVNTATTNASGLATSAVVTANSHPGGPYNVVASAPGAGTSASFSLTNNAGSPATVAVSSGSGQSATAGTAFTNPLVALVTDSWQNPVPNVVVTFAAPVQTGASATFSGGVNTATTNASGLATSQVVSANSHPGGPYNVVASASGAGTSASFSLTNIPSVPTISNLQAITIGGNSEVISWTTDQPSTTQVNYGRTSSYGSSSPLNTTLVTYHSVTLSNLPAKTTYNYDVVSTNSTNGNTASTNATFTTTPYLDYLAFWGINNSGVTISWSTDVAANTQLAYGITSALGQLTPLQSAMTNNHGVVLTGLNPGTIYFFQALSTTASGSTAGSTIYSFTTTGQAASPAPVISNVTVSGITTTSATITWTTDQASTSQVNFGTTTSYGSSSPLNSSPVTTHSVTLTGLTPGTTYDFDVVSINPSGTSSGASANNTFATTSVISTPPVISNILTSVTSTSVTITWTTDQKSNSVVNFGTTTAYGSTSGPDNNYVTSHSVTLNGLTAGTTYDCDVVSMNAASFSSTSPNWTFTTTAANVAPPYVGYVAFWGITNSGVTISWSTDVPANTQVAYGTTPALGQLTPVQAGLTNNHGVVLTDLNSGTTYYFVAESTGANGATGYSTKYSFTTTGTPGTPAPVITSVWAGNITPTSVTITWTTDQAASSQVNYGVTTTYTSSSTLDPTLVTAHSVTLTNLLPGTIYNCDVMSANSSNISSTSPNYPFATTGSAPGPVITAVAASNVTSGTAVITWTTNQASSSQVNYGATTAYGQSSTPNPALVTSHSVMLTGLTPNTSYNFAVASANSTNVSSTSSNYTFTTAPASAAPPVISYLGFWGITASGVTISWSTNVPSNTSVAFGTTNQLGQTSPVQTALTNSHGVTLAGLSPGTAYYFVAQSADVNGNTGYSSIYSFTTVAGPPTISAVTVTPTANGTAIITWTTSAPAYSYVRFGTAAGTYGHYSVRTDLTTTPQCTLLYLPGGVVHYQLVSTDVNGNQVVSLDATFIEP